MRTLTISWLAQVLRNFRPDELWVGNNPPIDAYKALLDEAAMLGVQLHTLRAGDSAALGGTQVRVLAPLANYQPGAEPNNNDSLVLHVRTGVPPYCWREMRKLRSSKGCLRKRASRAPCSKSGIMEALLPRGLNF